MTSMRIPGEVREDLRDFAEAHGFDRTDYDAALAELLPDDPDAEGLVLGESRFIDVDEEQHARLKELTGEGADLADTIRYYLNHQT